MVKCEKCNRTAKLKVLLKDESEYHYFCVWHFSGLEEDDIVEMTSVD